MIMDWQRAIALNLVKSLIFIYPSLFRDFHLYRLSGFCPMYDKFLAIPAPEG